LRDFAIIVTGTNIDTTKFKDRFDNVIFSTWIDQKHKFNDHNNVIFNNYPIINGPANFNLQKLATLSGLIKAKELGFKYALRTRGDVIFENPVKFLELLDNEDLNFLCWHDHEVYPKCKGYLVDYFMSGRITDMITLWSIDDIFCTVPEVLITWQYINRLSLTTKINYILNDLNSNNDIYFSRYNLYLSSYKINKNNDYKMFSFNNNKSELNLNYLNFLGTK
jgi:hypothetical protein